MAGIAGHDAGVCGHDETEYAARHLVLSTAAASGLDSPGDVPGYGEKGLTVCLTSILFNTDYLFSL